MALMYLMLLSVLIFHALLVKFSGENNYLNYPLFLSLVWFLFFWCRQIMSYCSLPSKNNCNNMFVFMPWKQSWLAGSLSNLCKAWQVSFIFTAWMSFILTGYYCIIYDQVCNSSKIINLNLSFILACSFAVYMLVNGSMITVVISNS